MRPISMCQLLYLKKIYIYTKLYFNRTNGTRFEISQYNLPAGLFHQIDAKKALQPNAFWTMA